MFGPRVPRRLGQTVSVVLAGVCLHALCSITDLSIAMCTAGLMGDVIVVVGVHSRLSLCDVRLEQVVLVTHWLKSLRSSWRPQVRSLNNLTSQITHLAIDFPHEPIHIGSLLSMPNHQNRNVLLDLLHYGISSCFASRFILSMSGLT